MKKMKMNTLLFLFHLMKFSMSVSETSVGLLCKESKNELNSFTSAKSSLAERDLSGISEDECSAICSKILSCVDCSYTQFEGDCYCEWTLDSCKSANTVSYKTEPITSSPTQAKSEDKQSKSTTTSTSKSAFTQEIILLSKIGETCKSAAFTGCSKVSPTFPFKLSLINDKLNSSKKKAIYCSWMIIVNSSISISLKASSKPRNLYVYIASNDTTKVLNLSQTSEFYDRYYSVKKVMIYYIGSLIELDLTIAQEVYSDVVGMYIFTVLGSFSLLFIIILLIWKAIKQKIEIPWETKGEELENTEDKLDQNHNVHNLDQSSFQVFNPERSSNRGNVSLNTSIDEPQSSNRQAAAVDINEHTLKIRENVKKLTFLLKYRLFKEYFRSIDNKLNIVQCTICIEDYKPKSEVMTLSCFHVFHVTCLRDWVAENIINPKCPNCNYEILSEVTERADDNLSENINSNCGSQRDSEINNVQTTLNKSSEIAVTSRSNVSRYRSPNYSNVSSPQMHSTNQSQISSKKGKRSEEVDIIRLNESERSIMLLHADQSSHLSVNRSNFSFTSINSKISYKQDRNPQQKQNNNSLKSRKTAINKKSLFSNIDASERKMEKRTIEISNDEDDIFDRGIVETSCRGVEEVESSEEYESKYNEELYVKNKNASINLDENNESHIAEENNEHEIDLEYASCESNEG